MSRQRIGMETLNHIARSPGLSHLRPVRERVPQGLFALGTGPAARALARQLVGEGTAGKRPPRRSLSW
jgi:hypothetical protein